MLKDKLLVWRFNRGDRDALRRIYQEHKADLLKVAAVLLEDKSGLEDVLHDVFVTFAQRSGKFRLHGSLKGYLAICVANRARDYNRAGQRQSAIKLDNAEAISSHQAGPECLAMSDELGQLLADAVAQLPYQQREVIVLRLQSKMRFRQIAQAQGVSVNTIQSRYRYGLDKLRSILNGKLQDETL